jgi:hypothetical protein
MFVHNSVTWNFIAIPQSHNCGILKTEAICSSKRLFELELHVAKSQKALIINTDVKASQKTVFFDQ